jgi:hypothetical protein
VAVHVATIGVGVLVSLLFFLGGTLGPGVDGVNVEEDVDDWNGLVNIKQRRRGNGNIQRKRMKAMLYKIKIYETCMIPA